MTQDISAPTGVQTLLRGLAVVQAVAAGARDLKEIGHMVGTTRSTTHRLAACLVQERYLCNLPGIGYTLGSRLIELGFQARDEISLATIAKPFVAALAQATGCTIHLAVREGDEVLYMDKIAGKFGLEMRSRIGHRMPVARTGVGKALMLDLNEAEWKKLFDASAGGSGAAAYALAPKMHWKAFQQRMQEYAAGGYALDLEDNEPSIRCVAAPIRDASGEIVAAVSVSSTLPYMSTERMQELIPVVVNAAAGISHELGGTRADRMK
ncbi:IclR family transcriptional regulator [Paraburkholderia bonniea]|uniref:IclR family transcriptional regulator n=1 Tax=Paraburkholderia bonniea TaxID=2152891 RepID=UPI0012918AEF|nr:IclR family transcriptional regulator [Paraburkholderia bonniea]WJF89424.1 IclR family transcriptional regulator [Paraburkholderia bonniea]WJF92739.1 IclR family transcriptional regulator [Paraburkholderia bonniea]